MTTALTDFVTPGVLIARQRKGKSAVHRVALALVWLTVATGAIVITEPAPIDALSIGLCILLPVIGLTRQTPWLWGGLAGWLIIAGAGYIGAFQAIDTAEATTHISVSLYLYFACALFAAFIARSPQSHTRLILNAYFFATIIASAAAIIGYLDLIPGSYEMFTRYDRAAGTFKDPNVLGPFLIPGLLIAVHLWLVRPLRHGLLPLMAAALITLAILLSFSRGAWAATAIAFAIYAALFLVTAQKNRDRLKIAGSVIIGTTTLGLILAAATQSPAVLNLLEQRAALTQPYDEGPEGRFGGQQKAFHLVLDNPLGIGGQSFTHYYHHEEAHNTYLTAFLNGGWIGGLTFLLLAIVTVVFGWRHALLNTKTQRLFLIAYAALVANLLESAVIDIDHWRHIYLLIGIVWGLMAGDTHVIRQARIVKDCRPILMSRVLLVPPSRRANRIVGTARPRLPASFARASLISNRRPRRPSRLVVYHS